MISWIKSIQCVICTIFCTFSSGSVSFNLVLTWPISTRTKLGNWHVYFINLSLWNHNRYQIKEKMLFLGISRTDRTQKSEDWNLVRRYYGTLVDEGRLDSVGRTRVFLPKLRRYKRGVTRGFFVALLSEENPPPFFHLRVRFKAKVPFFFWIHAFIKSGGQLSDNESWNE